MSGASNADVAWALSLVNDMVALGVIENDVKTRARYLGAALTTLRPASAIKAATAGETTEIGSTEGESAGPKADAQGPSGPSA